MKTKTKKKETALSVLKDIRDMLEQMLVSRAVAEHVKESDYWQIDIPQGLTLNQAFANVKALMPAWSYYGDLDKEITQNDRNSKKAYTVWVKKNIESDEEFKNKSANDLQATGHTGITLLEYLVLVAKVFREEGKYLDVDGCTLCAGSRHRDGFVPRGDWRGDGSYVGWCGAAGRGPGLGSRSVFLTLPL